MAEGWKDYPEVGGNFSGAGVERTRASRALSRLSGSTEPGAGSSILAEVESPQNGLRSPGEQQVVNSRQPCTDEGSSRASAEMASAKGHASEV